MGSRRRTRDASTTQLLQLSYQLLWGSPVLLTKLAENVNRPADHKMLWSRCPLELSGHKMCGVSQHCNYGAVKAIDKKLHLISHGHGCSASEQAGVLRVPPKESSCQPSTKTPTTIRSLALQLMA